MDLIDLILLIERKLSMTDDPDSSDDDLAFLQDDKQAGKTGLTVSMCTPKR